MGILKNTEMFEAETESAWIRVEAALPKVNFPVLYRTAIYQSAGYLGEDGNWYFASKQRERNPVIYWQSLD